MESFDVAVIGGGIAGVSCAARLAADTRVVLIESEPQLGVHSTGRSAALFIALYGNPLIGALTACSRDALYAARSPDGGTLVEARGVLFIADHTQHASLDRLRRSANFAGSARDASVAEAVSFCPLLRGERLAGAVYEPDASDVDVDLLLQYYASEIRRGRGRIVTGAAVHTLDPVGGHWRIATSAGAFTAPIVVNAAGAWADELAILAGVPPVGIQPYRRTAVIVGLPVGVDARRWPCVIDVDEGFYFKPYGDRLLVSPADETPCAAHDVQPEELDVAIAIDRLETVADIQVSRVFAKWAGLRSFAPDRSPVVGFDPDADGFFWLAGQGGYGIQTAPALSVIAASLIRAEAVGTDDVSPEIVAALSPVRLRATGVSHRA